MLSGPFLNDSFDLGVVCSFFGAFGLMTPAVMTQRLQIVDGPKL